MDATTHAHTRSWKGDDWRIDLDVTMAFITGHRVGFVCENPDHVSPERTSSKS